MNKAKPCPICALPLKEQVNYESLGSKRIVDLAKKLGHNQITLGYANKHRRDCRTGEDLLSLPQLPATTTPEARRVPKGWEEGVRWVKGSQEAVVTLPAVESEHAPKINEAAKYLEGMGFNPAEYDIEPIEVAKTDAAWHRDKEDIGEKFTAYTAPSWRAKFRITKKESSGLLDFDLEELVRIVGENHAQTPPRSVNAPETFLVGLADWQTGKRDGGGLKLLMQRLAALPYQIVARIKELQTLGRNIETIVLMGLGDLVEGCVGFYPSQQFGVEAYRREQMRVARRALVELVRVLAQLGIPVVMGGVPGNHGENRLNGKAFTATGDNDDLAVLEQAAEVFEDRPGFEHVSFIIPNNEMYLNLDLSGFPMLFAHGSGMGNGFTGMWTWFKNQRAHSNTTALGMWVGHYHHLHCEQDGILGLTQCTALEDRSDYYKDARGPETVSGTTTALVSSTFGQRDMQILLAI